MDIIRADELKVEHTKAEIIDALCQSIMNKIKIHAEKGYHSCCFHSYITLGDKSYSSDRYKDEIAKVFIDAGYTIKPTGYVGGVWQRTEDICW